jgi:hypothetical protein
VFPLDGRGRASETRFLVVAYDAADDARASRVFRVTGGAHVACSAAMLVARSAKRPLVRLLACGEGGRAREVLAIHLPWPDDA